MKLNNYHKLYNILKQENLSKLALSILKELYEDFKLLHIRLNTLEGVYGIEYKTVHDDSKYSETNYTWFILEEERDDVFNMWNKEIYWDDIFQTDIMYRLYGLNPYDFKKCVKLNDKIYVKN